MQPLINKNFQKGFVEEGLPIILLVLLLIGVVIFLFYNLKPTPTTPPTPPTAEEVKAKLLASPEQVDAFGDKLIKTTGQYQLAYIAKDDYFVVSLLSTPLSEARKAAEEELLQRSGNNLEVLCKLTFDIGAPLYVIQETGETVENSHALNICK